MEILEIDIKINSLIEKLEYNSKLLIHFTSIQNFLIYYKDLSPYTRPKVHALLEKLVIDLELINIKGFITKEISKLLFNTYIIPLGSYYKSVLNFKLHADFITTFILGLFYGLLVYIVFFIFGINYHLIIVIVLIIQISKWAYIKKIFLKNNKIDGSGF